MTCIASMLQHILNIQSKLARNVHAQKYDCVAAALNDMHISILAKLPTR